MSSTTIDSEILNCLPLLGEEEKKSILGVIKSFLTLKSKEKQDDRITIEQYNKELDEALARVVAGDYLAQEEVEQRSSKW